MRKKDMTALHKKGQLMNHQGKGAVEQTLPNRHAMQTLTNGDPGQRTMQNYAKATPMANPDMDGPDIQGM